MPSSVISHFHYEAFRRRLEVRFVSGRLYSYFDVPEDVVERMRRSTSKGGFFNAHIRDRYRFAREDSDA